MRRLVLDEDIRPMSEFRAGVASFLRQIHNTKRPLVITQHGRGVAVLMDVNEYEGMIDRIELLEDIQTAEKQLKQGKGIEHERAKAQVLKKIGR